MLHYTKVQSFLENVRFFDDDEEDLCMAESIGAMSFVDIDQLIDRCIKESSDKYKNDIEFWGEEYKKLNTTNK